MIRISLNTSVSGNILYAKMSLFGQISARWSSTKFLPRNRRPREVIPESNAAAAVSSELQHGTASLIIDSGKNSQAFIQVTDYVISTGCKHSDGLDSSEGRIMKPEWNGGYMKRKWKWSSAVCVIKLPARQQKATLL